MAPALNTLWFQTSGGVTINVIVLYGIVATDRALCRCRFGLHPDPDSIKLVLAWQLAVCMDWVLYKYISATSRCTMTMYDCPSVWMFSMTTVPVKYRNTVWRSVTSFGAKWTSICCIAQAKQSSPDRRISWCAFSVLSRLFSLFYSVTIYSILIHSPSWLNILFHIAEILKYSVTTYIHTVPKTTKYSTHPWMARCAPLQLAPGR